MQFPALPHQRTWYFGLVFFLFFCSTVHAELTAWEITSGIRFDFGKNELDQSSDPLKFQDDAIGVNVLLSVELEWTFSKFFDMNFGWDFEEFSIAKNTTGADSELQISVGDTDYFTEPGEDKPDVLGALLEETFFIKELYGTIYFNKKQWASLSIGIMNLNHARSVLYDNYAMGLNLEIDLHEKNPKAGLPLKFSVSVVLPDSSLTEAGKRSPMTYLGVDYVFKGEQHIGLFFVHLFDGDDLGAQLLLPIMQEQALNVLRVRTKQVLKKDIDLQCKEEIPAGIVAFQKKCLLRKRQLSLKCKQGKCTPQEKQILRSPCPETLYNTACNGSMASKGNHFWVGLKGKYRWKKLTIEGSAILYFSWMTLLLTQEATKKPKFLGKRISRLNGLSTLKQNVVMRPLDSHDEPDNAEPTVTKDLSLRGLGFAGELQATWHWTKAFTTSFFFLIATGDRAQVGKKTINTFMAISPSLDYTNVFFNGGINAYSAQRGISISGVTGRGYIVPGLTTTYDDDKLDMTFTCAPIWSMVKPIAPINVKTDTFYGLEFNLSGGYTVLPWFKPVFQVDLFLPGGFFAEGNSPAVMFRIYAGANLTFG